MNQPPEHLTGGIPAADASTGRQSRFSLVWLIPLVAALVGAWLVYTALTEKGPTITIRFETGDGLTADKTKIKYRDVEVGQVTGVALSDDLKGVIVTAEMVKEARQYLTDKTRFWVVRARVAAGEVTGLGTLLSGAYIGMEPISDGKRKREFVGLEQAPVVTQDDPGRYFTLISDRLGSVQRGTPVYFRQIKVGEVVDYELQDDGRIRTRIFVAAPNDQRIKLNTRFWNAGGIEFNLTAEGISFNMESLTSLAVGGIAFDTSVGLGSPEEAPPDHVFTMYASERDSRTPQYDLKEYYVLYFDQSVRGLKPGAPVEFRGFKMGQVVDIGLEWDEEARRINMPVLIEVEPERFWQATGTSVKEDIGLQASVDAGFRAQLQSGNLLTGAKLVGLDFFPNAEPVKIETRDGRPIFPTVPSPGGAIAQDVSSIVRKLDQLPLDQIGADLASTADGVNRLVNSPDMQQALKSLTDALEQFKVLSVQLGTEVGPSVTRTLQETERTVASVRRLVDEDSATTRETQRLLIELGEAARSIRDMADYLERHPEALLRGKGAQ
jgi:paraquat-inducible protein B